MDVGEGHLVEREGVHQVGVAAARDLRWLFRERPYSDFGIDGELEPVIDGVASGLLIGCQIKSGESYFREQTDSGVVFRSDRKHLEYWTRYANPVVVILYHPSDELLVWQVVSETTVEQTGVGWKLLVPRSQLVDRLAQEDLLSVARRDVEDLGRIRTEIQEPLVLMALSESQVVLEVLEWINKTSGRTDFRLLQVEPDGNENVLDQWMNFIGRASVPEAVQRLFPWSDPTIDGPFYEQHDESRFDEEVGIWDSEDGRYVHLEQFSEWAERRLPDGLRPYTDDGEIAYWRIVLKVNPIAWAHDLATALPADHQDRVEWLAALEEAEMTHQAEAALRQVAERVIDRHTLQE